MRPFTSAIAAVSLFGLAGVASAEEPTAGAGATQAQPAQTQAAPAQQPAQPTQAAPAQPGSSAYTDAQLQAFAAASLEIERVREQAQSSGGPNAQTQTAMRDILTRHQLDAETYNGIVNAMQADQSVAQRVMAYRSTPGTAHN